MKVKELIKKKAESEWDDYRSILLETSFLPVIHNQWQQVDRERVVASSLCWCVVESCALSVSHSGSFY